MGIADDIAKLLSEGNSPQTIIKELGYKRSTVYKVLQERTSLQLSINPPPWMIENIHFGKPRYLPKEKCTVTYSVKNSSNFDLYLYKTGIQTEWMVGTWNALEARLLLRAGEAKPFTITLDLPDSIALGEYDLRFGIEGQFLGQPNIVVANTYVTEFSTPIVIDVKRPPTGVTVFVSHSTNDLHLVRQLANYLDNFGIEAIIAEDTPEPGKKLDEKFQTEIRNSKLLLALLTSDGIRSDWVRYEIEYADKIGKPLLLLKESGVAIQSKIEWVEFSRNEGIEALSKKIVTDIEKINSRMIQITQQPVVPLAGVLVVGILAFIAGLALGSRE